MICLLIKHMVHISTKTSKIRTQKRKKEKEEFIGSFDEAPEYLQDNQYLLHGYRINFNRISKILKSLFLPHNELMNIWTHLIGFIIIFIIILQGAIYKMDQSHILGKKIIEQSIKPFRIQQFNSTLQNLELCKILNQGLQDINQYDCNNFMQSRSMQKIQQKTTVPTWPIMICLLGGGICLACSTIFHLIHPINAKIFKYSRILDYAGIGVNMTFSPVPAFYYTMYCQSDIKFLYIILMMFGGIASFITSLSDWITKKENLIYRAIIYSFSAVVSSIGLVHMIVIEMIYNNYGDKYRIAPSLYFYIPTLLSYLIGFIFYQSKCPERNMPGRFDICGHSHQIWHIFVFISIFFAYLGALVNYEIRNLYPQCPASMMNYFS